MHTLRAILLTHVRQYPRMEPRDAVKLLYQNEFGGGHLIADAAACLSRLRKEYVATPQSKNSPLLENLGNHIFRVNLAALDAWGYDVDALAGDFIRSSALHTGNTDSFLNKLELLKDMTAKGELPFSSPALEDYLQGYAAAGYPPVSHSDTYRKCYHPAYRVVSESCLPDHIQKHRMP